MASVILNVSGSDRPGLTEALAGAVLSAGGNWLESHLSRLGGLYVGSVRVELAADRIEALRAAVRRPLAWARTPRSLSASKCPGCCRNASR